MICRILFALILCTNAFGQDASLHQEIVNELNAVRKDHKRQPLVYSAKYQGQCDDWAKHLVKRLEHASTPQGVSEVISTIYGTSDLIIPQFMASDRHKGILLDKKAKEICLSIFEVPADTTIQKDGVVYTPRAYYTVIRTY